jgi:hypothetical protein
MLQRIIHTIVYAAIRAYFDAVRDARLFQEEQPTDSDRARADRFRAAVERVRTSDADTRNTGPINSPSNSCPYDGTDLCPHNQRHDHSDGTGPRRVVDSQPNGDG